MYLKLFDEYKGKKVRFSDGTKIVFTHQSMALHVYNWIEDECETFWYDVEKYLHPEPKRIYAKAIVELVAPVFFRCPFGKRPPTATASQGG